MNKQININCKSSKEYDYEFINSMMQKYSKMFINLGNYIKRKNFTALPYDDHDFESVLYASLKIMQKVKKEAIEKYSYLTILKRIFVQNLISLNRHYNTCKQKVMAIATSYDDKFTNNSAAVDDALEDFNLNYDLKLIYDNVIERLKSSIDKKIFQLYLLNVKPNRIAEITNQTAKRVYNSIFAIKNICSEYKSF